jgi:hypothetical protein
LVLGFGSVSLVLLLDCLCVVDALKMQGVDAYIGAESSGPYEQQKEGVQ